MAKRIKGCLDFSEAVADGENENGVTLVTPNTDQVGTDYLGRQQWNWGNRDGDRWRPFGADPMDMPSAVPAQQGSIARKKK